jgi:hypothetical protein
VYSSQLEPQNKWTIVSNNRGRPTHEEAPRAPKLIKESDYCLNTTSTHNRYSALLEDESEDQQQTTDSGITTKPPPTYVSNVTTTILPLIQLLEQYAMQFEIMALAGNQVEIKPKTSESYKTIKPLAKKRTAFDTYKLKEERNYRAVLKISTTPLILKKSSQK